MITDENGYQGMVTDGNTFKILLIKGYMVQVLPGL